MSKKSGSLSKKSCSKPKKSYSPEVREKAVKLITELGLQRGRRRPTVGLFDGGGSSLEGGRDAARS